MTPLPLWFEGLTPELRRKAELELGETDAVREKALKEFTRLIKEEQDISSRLDETFLLRFLRSKKYDVQRALKVLRNYFANIAKHKTTIAGRTPSQLKHVLETNYVNYVPQRMPTGSHLAIFRFGSFDIRQGSIEDHMAAIFLFGEMLMQCEASQVCGGTYITDYRGMSLAHYRAFLSMSFLSFSISVAQDCSPERVCGIHVVNEPRIFHFLFRTLKPLMSKKLTERLHFHGSNLDSLHSHVPKDLLPEELGGNTGPFDNREFADYFLSQETYIEGVNRMYGILGEEPQ